MQTIRPLISTRWLSGVLTPGLQSLKVLDTLYGNGPKETYKQAHIPGALPFDIYKCSDQTSPYETMLPSPDQFADYVGDLGIDNDTHVILYDANPKVGMFAPPRVWWMFHVFGHRKVSILDGGLKKWISEGHPVSNTIPDVEPTKFRVDFQPHLVKNFEDMLGNLENSQFQVMDARPAARFIGETPEPRDDIPRGSIPNSVNIPFITLFNEDGTVKSPEDLAMIFKEANINLDQPTTATCGMGITACILKFCAHLIGKEKVAVYDGSWEEISNRAPERVILSSLPTPAAG